MRNLPVWIIVLDVMGLAGAVVLLAFFHGQRNKLWYAFRSFFGLLCLVFVLLLVVDCVTLAGYLKPSMDLFRQASFFGRLLFSIGIWLLAIVILVHRNGKHSDGR